MPRRLSRKALAALAGVSALGVAAALDYSLTTSRHGQHAPQPVAVDHRATSDVLTDAPQNYADLSRKTAGGLGPPPTSPSVAEPEGSHSDAPMESKQANVEHQRRDSARASKLFAGADGSAGTRSMAAEVPPSPAGQPATGQSAASSNRDAQDRKVAFVISGARESTVNSGRLTAPAGRYVLSAGSTIAAALITGLSSDLPGEVVAQVTENVFDSATGRTLLIPQGARLIGSYDAHVSYGQERALAVWTRLILPDGRSIDLDRMIGTDPSGQSGFADRVDHHTGTLFKAALLSTLFGLGTHIATGGDHNDIANAIRDSAGQSVDRAGDKLVGRQLDVQPTIAIRPGARVRVLVGRDLVLGPWRDRRFADADLSR
jgi:type IV secretion system protein VirB10